MKLISHIPRREFLKGSFSTVGLAAFGGGRLFAAPAGWRPVGDPLLVLGVMSDTHLRTRRSRKPTARWWPDTFLRAALEHFRAAKVDAVVHCGDMANYGEVEAMQMHADIWNAVFPGGKAADGHAVEKLFITGNHDVLGSGMNEWVRNLYSDPDVRRREVLAEDMAGNWERIWGEPYHETWHKEIKGYHFFGAHWGVSHGRLAKLVKKVMGKKPSESRPKPFFMLTHARPLPPFRKSLAAYSRDAVAFFGHNHISATNWNTIYYDEGSFPRIQVPPCISPDWDIKFKGDAYIAKAPLEGKEQTGRCRQGFVVKIYDDMMVIERREFAKGGSLGPDWVMPFGVETGKHPFAKEELKKIIGEPQFREGAKLEVVKCCQCENVARSNVANDKLKNGTGNGNIGNTGNIQRLCVKIPLADGNPKSRVYAYEVVIEGRGKREEGSGRLCKAVYAAGCNMGIGHEPNGGVTTLEIAKSELPPGKNLTVSVRPLTSLGTAGRPIMMDFKV